MNPYNVTFYALKKRLINVSELTSSKGGSSKAIMLLLLVLSREKLRKAHEEMSSGNGEEVGKGRKGGGFSRNLLYFARVRENEAHFHNEDGVNVWFFLHCPMLAQSCVRKIYGGLIETRPRSAIRPLPSRFHILTPNERILANQPSHCWEEFIKWKFVKKHVLWNLGYLSYREESSWQRNRTGNCEAACRAQLNPVPPGNGLL